MGQGPSEEFEPWVPVEAQPCTAAGTWSCKDQSFLAGTKFEICPRYTVLRQVGQGAYGVVCAAQDEEAKESIAIKKIGSVFETVTITKRTLRELRILRHLRHENIVDVRNIFIPGQKHDFEDIYVVSELMETDLSCVIKSSQPLTDSHIQFLLYQTFRGIKYVHSAGVIHRDLKPRNLLVNINCDLKICDFGLARLEFAEKQEFQLYPMTNYICTRWFRAPELLLSWSCYTKAIDVWAIGCIFAEMLNRKPLFPGSCTRHMLELVIDLLGTPPPNCRSTNDRCKKFIDSLTPTVGKPFRKKFREATGEQLDLLSEILKYSPEERATVDQALGHPYLEDLHFPDDEPTREPLEASDFEFERRRITKRALREELYLEALRYHPDRYQTYAKEQEKLSRKYSILDFHLLAPGEVHDDYP